MLERPGRPRLERPRTAEDREAAEAELERTRTAEAKEAAEAEEGGRG
jgi:hypothetical protein